MDILIEEMYLHILDAGMPAPVLSAECLEPEDHIVKMAARQIGRCMDDAAIRPAQFLDDLGEGIPTLCARLRDGSASLGEVSSAVADRLFRLMQQHVDIQAADVMFLTAMAGEERWLMMLKLNHRTGYTHTVRNLSEGCATSIIRHKAILPGEAQKIDEAFFVRLSDLYVRVLEKKVEINGEKEHYLSLRLLRCTTDFSTKEKIEILREVTEKVSQKYFEDDFEKPAKLTQVISAGIDAGGGLEVSAVAEALFGQHMEVREAYVREIQEAGLEAPVVTLEERSVERRFRTQKIKTDTGVEIHFPPEHYQDASRMEFINEPDGTISIVIRNVGKITNK